MSKLNDTPKRALNIRPLAQANISALCALVREIWIDTYPQILPAGQTEYMLEQFHTAEYIRAQIAQGQHFFTAEHNDQWLGFIAAEVTALGKIHIHKLYVLPSAQGQGIGAQLLDFAIGEFNAQELTLAVNRDNLAAINFYICQGFTILRKQLSDIGSGFVMDDFIMRKSCHG